MNINLTLIGQAISFAIFVWFCMKFVWPPITSALEQRKKTIADGLSAAELGEQALEKAKKRLASGRVSPRRRRGPASVSFRRGAVRRQHALASGGA